MSKNSGPGAARNIGLKKAKGEYIFLLDVDDKIASNTLTLLYEVQVKLIVTMFFLTLVELKIQ